MAKIPPFANRRGMTAALDIVEDALASLQEKVKHQQQRPSVKDAATNTSPLQSRDNTQTSFTGSHRESKQKQTSVLIKRRTDRARDRSSGHRQQYREGTIKVKKKQKTRSQQQVKNQESSLHSNDTSEKSSRDRDSNTSQRDCSSFSEGIKSQRGNCIPKHSGSSSKKRDSRNREESSEMSSDESLLRRKFKLQANIPPENSHHSCKGSQKMKYPSYGKRTVPVSDQRYAQPTLTSQLRDELLSRKKEEKENLLPFIPCGSKSKSYHMGVIVQRELGRLKNMPAKELEHLTVPHTRSQESDVDETGSDSSSVTEQTVKKAMANIQQHIALARKHSSKD